MGEATGRGRRELTPKGKMINKRLIDLGMIQRELATQIGTTPQQRFCS